jgi:hypothetical protein
MKGKGSAQWGREGDMQVKEKEGAQQKGVEPSRARVSPRMHLGAVRSAQ